VVQWGLVGPTRAQYARAAIIFSALARTSHETDFLSCARLGSVET
jgi:hypothetical protein